MVSINCEFGDWNQILESSSSMDIKQEILIQLGGAAEVEYIVDGDKTTKVNS